jgi:hypothetical protein
MACLPFPVCPFPSPFILSCVLIPCYKDCMLSNRICFIEKPAMILVLIGVKILHPSHFLILVEDIHKRTWKNKLNLNNY